MMLPINAELLFDGGIKARGIFDSQFGIEMKDLAFRNTCTGILWNDRDVKITVAEEIF